VRATNVVGRKAKDKKDLNPKQTQSPEQGATKDSARVEEKRGEEGANRLATKHPATSLSHRRKRGISDDISWHEIRNVFHLPLSEASKEMGVCDTVLKQHCRKLGLKKWPHRQWRQIQNLIDKAEIQLEAEKKGCDNRSLPSKSLIHLQGHLKKLRAAMQSLMDTGEYDMSFSKKRKKKKERGKEQGTEYEAQATVTPDVEVKPSQKENPKDSSVVKQESSSSSNSKDKNLPRKFDVETGFRINQHEINTSTGDFSRDLLVPTALLNEANSSLNTDILSMDFNKVFDDEEEAAFCESLAPFVKRTKFRENK